MVAALTWTARLVLTEPVGLRRLNRWIGVLAVLVMLQLVLGIETWISRYSSGVLPELQPATLSQGLLRTGHFLAGTLIFATAVVTALMAWRSPAKAVVLAGSGGGRMKATATVCATATPLARMRIADYLELTKPRVQVLVLFTVAVGALLAPGGKLDFLVLLNTLLGTASVAAGASALNQLLERRSDARMVRTENRPLPAGRLQPSEVLTFGILMGAFGITYLAVALPRPYAALVAACTFVCYAFVYTPLKSKTTLNTLVGAVPGALPPVIGWTAMAGPATFTPMNLLKAGVLFLIVFLWQIPHFLAIAWIYREDYARAGLRMLPVVDRHGGADGLADGELLHRPDPGLPRSGRARRRRPDLFPGGVAAGLGLLDLQPVLPPAAFGAAGAARIARLAALPAGIVGPVARGRALDAPGTRSLALK